MAVAVFDPLLQELSGALHRLKTTPQPIRDGHHHLIPFCETLELVFRHGLKQPNSWFGLNRQDYWSWVEPLQDYYFNEKQNPLLREVVHDVATSPHLHSLQGKGRCFMRIALCKKLISVPIEHLVRNSRLTNYWYQEKSIVASPALRKALMAILFDVTALDFELQVESSAFLDETWVIPVFIPHELPPIKTLDIRVGYSSGRAIVVEIERGCLAEKAGVEPGDCLVELCGESVSQMHHQKLKQLLVSKPMDTTDLVVVKSILPDGCPFYPLLSRKLTLEPSSPKSPKSPMSPFIKSLSLQSPSPLKVLPPLHPPPSSLSYSDSLPPYTEYKAVFLGRIDQLTEQPNQALINDVIARVLTTPTDPSDLVIRVGSTDVTLLADKRSRLLGEFPYSSLCGCGQGTTHRTCFTIVSVHMATGQTSFTSFVCEAVSFELAHSICEHIAFGFSGDKT